MFKTYYPTADEIDNKWFVVDAQDQVLGRLASEVAQILRGKHKPQFTPHLDTGDYVIVINAEKIRLSGKKSNYKAYFRHSGYIGNERSTDFNEMLAKHPDRIIKHAVKGMLPHNRLGRQIIKKLKVYRGADHPHAAQEPKPLKIKG